MTLTRTLIAVAALALAQPALAQTASDAASPATDAATMAPVAGTYSFDPHHSQILFSYDHMGFSTSTGMVRGVTGEVTLDPETPANSSVTASFPLSSLMTVSRDLDQHLMSDDAFLASAPDDAVVNFASTKVEPSGDDQAKVTGDLTLNGKTVPVTLDVRLRKAGENPMEKKPAAGFEATTTVKRSDFGLGAFAPAVGDDVSITIVVEAMKP